MTHTLADIESLVLQCRSDQTREYLSEAVLCYRSGAYRAAIVTTWLAVVFDLIDKIRDLALSGDANAKTIEGKHETYLQQMDQGNQQGVKKALEFERDILKTCKEELQFFDQQQFSDLERLREDRHRCAHPSFQKIGEPYRPSAEQARLHFRNAVVHVLSQAPLQGRAAIAGLRVLVSSLYFPADTLLAITQLRSSPLEKASEALVRGFTDDLLFGFFDKTHALYHKARVIAAINACLEMHRSITERRLSKHLPKLVRDQPDSEFLFGVTLIARIAGAWGMLDVPATDKIRQLVRNGEVSDLAKVLVNLESIEELKLDIEARLSQLTTQELAAVIRPRPLRDLGKKRALQLLSEAKSWATANDVVDKVILPQFESLDRSDIEAILRYPAESGADLLYSTGLSTIVERVRQTTMFTPDELDSLLKTHNAGYLVPGSD